MTIGTSLKKGERFGRRHSPTAFPARSVWRETDCGRWARDGKSQLEPSRSYYSFESDVTWEIQHADIVIRSLSGRSTRPLFRTPFGARNQRVLGVIHALGYQSIYWSLDSLDSVGAPKSASFIVARIANQPDQILDGAIVLFHVGTESTARALPEILRVLKARHFECVVVSSLIPMESEIVATGHKGSNAIGQESTTGPQCDGYTIRAAFSVKRVL